MDSPCVASGIPYNAMPRRMRANRNAAWASVLTQPFAYPSVHIPDDNSTCSGLCSSRVVLTFTPSTRNGANVSTHMGGLLLLPSLNNAYYTLYETAAGTAALSDLNTAGDGYNGSYGAVTNASAILPTSGRVRCVGMGLRVVYEGTELNRAGRFYAGLCPIQHPAIAGAGAPFPLSALSVVCAGTSVAVGTLKACLNEMVTSRVIDGVFEVCWRPSGVPHYQGYSDSAAGWLPYQGTGAGAVTNPSQFNAPVSGYGVEGGQNALVFFVEGDTTDVAQSVGNTYSVELVYHWEAIPNNPAAVAYDLSPSRANFNQLASALNAGGVRRLGVATHDAIYSVFGSDATPATVAPAPQRRSAARKVLKAARETIAQNAGPVSRAALDAVLPYVKQVAGKKVMGMVAASLMGAPQRRRLT